MFQANLAVGVLFLSAFGCSLLGGIITHTTTRIVFTQLGVIAMISGVGVLFFKRLMPRLTDGVVKLTNQSFGKVLSVVLSVIFAYVLLRKILVPLSLLVGTMPKWLGAPIQTVVCEPAKILHDFLGFLQLPTVAWISLGGFVLAVIVESMFLPKRD